MFVYVCECMCAFGGPQGPVLMSYLCAFLTRALCSAHGTVILDRGWPCWAARLCRLLYLWYHHHHHVQCFCVLLFASVCIPGALECRGLTQEANTVYISIMNQVRERNRKSKRAGGGREGDMEKAIFPLLFSSLLCSQPLWWLFPLFCILILYFFLPRILPLVPLCLARSDRLYWTKHSVSLLNVLCFA